MVKKIIASGDIHIFKNKRFNEHETVFEKFYKDIEREKPDILTITGDLIDSKVNNSPEQAKLVFSHLKKLSDYAPVLLLIGNHDLNLQNKERENLLEVIVNQLEGNTKFPIHYFDKSGIYNLYGMNWCVWSCVEDQKNPFKITKHYNEDYKIGLYHGSIKGCIADNGFRLSAGVDVEEFDNVNICICSDIHMQQSFRNNEINYTGSFIQTKNNEPAAGSYLIYTWDTKKKNYYPEIIRLDNPFAVQQVEVKNLEQDIEFDSKLYDTQLIQLVYDRKSISKSSMIDLRKKLQSLYTNNKIETRPKVNSKKKIEKEEINQEESEDILQLSLSEIFEKYVEKNTEYLSIKDFNKDLKSLKDLEEYYSKNLNTDKDFEQGDYFIQTLKINNLYCFPPEDIEFDQFALNEILGIVGKNRIGKSTLIKCIQFGFFESVPNNTSSFKKIINKHNRNKEAYVELIINKQGTLYSIKRTIIPKKTDNVSFTLTFNEINEDLKVTKSLNGEKKQETQKNINKCFGVEDLFEKLSLFSAQKKQVEFIDCKNADRLKLVGQFLGLQDFEKKSELVGDDLKVKNKLLVEKTNDFNTSLDVDSLKVEIKELEHTNDVNKDKLISISKNKEQVQREKDDLISGIQKQKSVIDQDYVSEDILNTKINNKNKEIITLKESKKFKDDDLKEIENKKVLILETIQDFEHQIGNVEELINKQKETIDSFDSEKIDKQIANIDLEIKQVNETISELKQDKIKASSKLENEQSILKTDLQRKEKQLKIDVCNNCGKEFSEEDKKKVSLEIEELKKSIEKIDSKIINSDEVFDTKIKENKKLIIEKEEKKEEQKELQVKIKNEEKTLRTYQEQKNEFEKKIEKQKQEQLKLDSEVVKIENKYLNIDNEINKLIIQIEEYEKEISKAQKIEKDIEKAKIQLKELEVNKTEKEQEYSILQSSINELNTSIGINTNKIENLQNDIEKFLEKKKALEVLEDEVRIHKAYKKIVNKDGLPLFILQEKISSINQEINIIANQIFDFDIEFIIDEDSGELNLEFKYESDEEKSDVSLASGAETFVINLCIKVGLSQLTEIPKLQTLFVDEGFGTLDKDNIDKIPILFNTLLNYYKNIVLISHLDELKDTYTSQIVLEKEGKYTTVVN